MESRSHTRAQSRSQQLTLSSRMDFSSSVTNKKASSTDKKEKMVSRRVVLRNEGEDINEMADAFIKNFRKQLKIERQESLQRLQDMINRGA